jgi:hypothetical protein
MAFIPGTLNNAVLGDAFIAASKTSVRGDLRSSSPASAVFQLPLCELSCSDCESPSSFCILLITRRRAHGHGNIASVDIRVFVRVSSPATQPRIHHWKAHIQGTSEQPSI